MDKPDRRGLLVTRANPDPRADLLVELDMSLSPRAANGPVSVTIRYVPDRWLVDPDALAAYAAAFEAGPWSGLEPLALAVRDDLNNEAVPRWLQVAACGPSASGSSQRVLVEDRQPRWDNPALLARLKPF